MKKIILSTLACATLMMANNAPQYEFSPMFGKANAHDRLNLENDKSLGATFAIKDNYTFFDQLELAYFNTSDVKFDTVLGNTDVNRLLVSGVKNYALGEKSSLYALVGAGYEKFSKKAIHADSSSVINVGAGFKYSITDAIGLKAEARRICRAGDLRESTALYSLGLAIPFGESAKKVAPKTKKAAAKVASDVNKVESNSIDMSKNVISHFDTDKAILKADDKLRLDEYVTYLKAFPKAKLVVEGHTDSTASETYNKSLAARRAMATKAYIVDLGIDSSRVRTESYGETMPVIDNKTKAHRAMNRRTEVKIFR
jgi:OOP family OmpA-OmpF porin